MKTKRVMVLLFIGMGLWTTADVALGQENRPPVSHAGADRSVKLSPGLRLAVIGSKSYDPDGDPLTYRWSISALPTGSMARLSDDGAVSPIFTPDVVGDYEFQLVVSDETVESAADFVKITGVPPDPMVEKIIGRAGGVLELQGTLNRIRVEIPADALAADTELTIRQVSLPAEARFFYPGVPIGNTFSFEPHDLKFNRVVDVTFTYQDEDIPEGEEEGGLIIYVAHSMGDIFQGEGGAICEFAADGESVLRGPDCIDTESTLQGPSPDDNVVVVLINHFSYRRLYLDTS